MIRVLQRVLILLIVLAVVAPLASVAQISGRVFMPDGSPVTEQTEIRIDSQDFSVQGSFVYTDSLGRFKTIGLSSAKWYTLTILGDKKTFATTTIRVSPSSEPYINIHLNAIEGFKAVPKTATVSTDELREPLPKAKAVHDDGMRLIADKKFDAAAAKFREAIKIDPDFSAPYNDLAVILIDQRKYADASQVARDGLKKNPDSMRLLFNLGKALNFQSKFDDAKQPLRAALRKQPGWANAEAQLGIALEQTGDLQAARPCLERGMSAGGDDRVFDYLYLGNLYAQQSQYPEALYVWDEYLKLDGKSPNAAQVSDFVAKIRQQGIQKAAEITPSGVCQ